MVKKIIQAIPHLKRSQNLLTSKQSEILVAAMLVMVSYAISLILGLWRQRLMGSFFYQCCAAQLDVYQAAFRIPDLLFQISAGGIISAAFVPLFVKDLAEKPHKAYETASGILNTLLIFFLLLTIPVLLGTGYIIPLVAKGFSPEQQELMASLMWWLLCAQGIFVISNWMSAILQTNHRFLVPALAPLIYNAGIIAGIYFLVPFFGIKAAAIGVVIGAVAHLLLQLPVFFFLEGRYIPILPDRELFTELLSLGIPRTLTAGITQLESWVTAYFASHLMSGSLFLFDLAVMLRQVPIQMIGMAIGQAALPRLAKLAHSDKVLFAKTVQENVLQMIYLVFPITAMLLILRIPIVRLAFGSQSFPWDATVQTAWTLAMFTLAIPALAVNQLLLRSYFAIKDTHTPLYIFIISIVLLTGSYQVLGGHSIFILAFCVTFVSIVRIFALGWGLKKWLQINPVFIKELQKLSIAALIMVGSLWLPFRILDALVFNTTRVIPLIAFTITTGAIGALVYVCTCHFLDIRSQRVFWGLLVRFPGFAQVLRKTQALFTPQTEI